LYRTVTCAEECQGGGGGERKQRACGHANLLIERVATRG
jgi:hypothetical protein